MTKIKATELFKALSGAVQKRGGNNTHLNKILTDKSCLDKIADLLVADISEPVVVVHPCQRLVPDLIPKYRDTDGVVKKYEIIEDVELSLSDDCDIEFSSPPEEETVYSFSAGQKVKLGLCDAKYVMDHQYLIPPDLRGKYLVFPGTVLRYIHGQICVPYLYWGQGRWQLEFDFLYRDWFGSFRLVSRKETL